MDFSKTNGLACKRSFVLLPNNLELGGSMLKELIVNANTFFRRAIVRHRLNAVRRTRVVDEARAFLRDDGGATMVEYAFMVMLIAIVCVATVSTVGSKLSTLYDTVASDF